MKGADFLLFVIYYVIRYQGTLPIRYCRCCCTWDCFTARISWSSSFFIREQVRETCLIHHLSAFCLLHWHSSIHHRLWFRHCRHPQHRFWSVVSEFDHLVLWHHDFVPPEDHCLQNVGEWYRIAKAVSASPLCHLSAVGMIHTKGQTLSLMTLPPFYVQIHEDDDWGRARIKIVELYRSMSRKEDGFTATLVLYCMMYRIVSKDGALPTCQVMKNVKTKCVVLIWKEIVCVFFSFFCCNKIFAGCYQPWWRNNEDPHQVSSLKPQVGSLGFCYRLRFLHSLFYCLLV